MHKLGGHGQGHGYITGLQKGMGQYIYTIGADRIRFFGRYRYRTGSEAAGTGSRILAGYFTGYFFAGSVAGFYRILPDNTGFKIWIIYISF
jgi:hypothetical protein